MSLFYNSILIALMQTVGANIACEAWPIKCFVNIQMPSPISPVIFSIVANVYIIRG